MGKAVKRLEITYYDKDTGEILASVDPEELVKKLEWKAKRKRAKVINELYGGKVMIFQEILKKAVKELTEGELRVFNYMLGVMDFENWIGIPQKEIAKEVGIHPKTISRIMKRLVEKGYIEIYKKGRENYYRIRPEVAWKGTEREHLKVLRNNNPILDTMLKK
jgi:DNA-binding MarR family transcriptional regulator